MSIQFSDLDRLCTVLVPVTKRGSSGGVSSQYREAFQFYAKKSGPSSREFRAAGVSNSEVAAMFTTHFNPALAANQIFECEGEYYEIVGPPVEPDDGSRRRWHVIQAKTAQEVREAITR